MICFHVKGVALCFGFSFFTVLSLVCIMHPGSCLMASACAILLHESAHLLMMVLLRQKLKSITFHGCGIRICPTSALCSYQREAAVLLAGPVCNLLAGGMLLLFHGSSLFAGANLALGLVNLLPCRHMDGGAALRCILSLFPWEMHRCEWLLTIIVCGLLVLFLGGAWLLGVRNFTYYALGLYLFFAEIFR